MHILNISKLWQKSYETPFDHCEIVCSTMKVLKISKVLIERICFFVQLLSALNSVAENCLPALLRALFDWYDRQNPMDEAGNCLYRRTSKNRG